jgi:citrate lyase subunit beta / citryl-CoA lyase
MTFLLRRSELAVPASNDHMFARAAASEADLVFLDLEDATAPAHKEAARAKAVTALNELDWGRTVRAIRINGLDTQWCHDDIVEVVTNARENLETIIIPKALRARDVWWVDVLLTQLEAKLGLTRQIRLERLLAIPGRPGRHQLRPTRRIPRRLLGVRPQQGDRRRPHRGHRRDRRALSRLRQPGGLPA